MTLTHARLVGGMLALASVSPTTRAAAPTVTTILGTGAPGYSNTQVNNPYGIIFGPDGAIYFCDLENQRIRRLDLKTNVVTTIAGSGEKGYRGDGGPATEAALNMPHEIQFDGPGNLYIAERDSNVIRKVEVKTRVISTVAGTGAGGYGGDGGPGVEAQLRQPHSIVFDRDGTLLICDIGNQRIRRLHLDTGAIETYAGTGQAADTPEGAPVSGTPLRGPRTMVLAPNGDLYLALREGNAILRIDARSQTLHRLAGTGEQGYSGDGGQARNAKLGGPKGLRTLLGNSSSRTPRTMPCAALISRPASSRQLGQWCEGRRPGTLPSSVQAVASARRTRRRVRYFVRER